MAFDSKKILKLLDRQAGISGDAAHRKGIDRIVSWDREDANSIRHHNVLTLAENSEARSLQSSHCFEVVDSWNLWHD